MLGKFISEIADSLEETLSEIPSKFEKFKWEVSYDANAFHGRHFSGTETPPLGIQTKEQLKYALDSVDSKYKAFFSNWLSFCCTEPEVSSEEERYQCAFAKTMLVRNYLSNDGKDLSDLNLNDVNLSGCDLSDVDFSNSYLRYANLENSNITEANFENTNLTSANLIGLDFRNSKLLYTIFDCANLTGSNFNNQALDGCSFLHANLTDSDLRDIVLLNNKLFAFSKVTINRAKVSYNFFDVFTPFSIETIKIFPANFCKAMEFSILCQRGCKSNESFLSQMPKDIQNLLIHTIFYSPMPKTQVQMLEDRRAKEAEKSATAFSVA